MATASGVAVEPNDSTIKLRSYQTEMLDRSLERNTIVAMDTGSGKTHIAVARIRAELERVSGDKLVWFLTPSRTLAEQQYHVLETELSAYGIRLLTGADGVEKWTDQRLWDAVLTNIRVVVATPAVLRDALSHAFVKISRLALCVFDEAHRCTKNHPMNQIMQLFYRPALDRREEVPHILGLSASPVMSTKQGSLQAIESNLHSLAITPKVHRAELEKYVNPPELRTIRYNSGQSSSHPATDPLCEVLAQATRSYTIALDPYVLELKEIDDQRSQRTLAKVLLKHDTYCLQQLRALDLRATALQKQLGVSMARWYVSTCIQKFRIGSTSQQSFLPDLSEKERAYLLAIFNQTEQRAIALDSQKNAEANLFVSSKATQLLDILQQHAKPDVRGIVFVEQRVQVTAMAELLRRTPEISSIYTVAAFVGTSTNTNRNISIADLVGLEDQDDDLRAFREGSKNLMIATNVLEEGIDISACNLVICFDAPKNLISFVQRRGRARQKDSTHFLFASDEECKKGNKPWSALEAEMKAMYMDDLRTPVEEERVEPQRSYEVPSTGALLTMDDAKSHLYHFCSVSTSQASSYVDLRPEFATQEHLGSGWTVEVELPACVHISVRRAASSKVWRNEEDAVKDASFEAYIALHKAGLVNDHLLPLVKNYGPEIGQQHADQPSLMQVADQKSLLNQIWHASNVSTVWSSSTAQLWLGEKLLVEVSMWLPAEIPPIAPFELYWNSYRTYQIRMVSRGTQEVLSGADQACLRGCTATLLTAVHRQRMSTDSDDFAVLFSSAELQTTGQWTARHGERQTAASVLATNNIREAFGLVRVTGQEGRLFFLEAFSQDFLELTVGLFPKRKDFLHPIDDESALTTAHTAKQIIPTEACTIDALPAKYALFAAFVPSILHRLDTHLLVHDLVKTTLKDVVFSEPSLVLEAISSPAASEPSDYNRLEYLGDCILKHCTELQVMSQHTTWPEAFLTLERDRIVRNSNLAKAALECGLDEYILSKPFTGSKWRPPYVSEILEHDDGQRQMSTKTLADVVEALIGAAYVDGGLEKAFCCIKTLLPREVWDEPSQCFYRLLEELNPSQVSNLSTLETLVGHTFVHPSLLVEAITHVSFPYHRTGMSYERLEFLGDSVLDIIIPPKLFAHPRKLKHWDLHSIHGALVNSHFLGYCCLQYGSNDKRFDVAQDASGRRGAIPGIHTVHLYDVLRAGAQLGKIKRETVAYFEQIQPQIEHALVTGKQYPWVELVTLSAPKFFSDLVESILGAIFVDTQGDLAACEAFIERLGILRHMQRILDEGVDCVSPKEMLGVVADQDDVKYCNAIAEDEHGKKSWKCTVQVGGREYVTINECRSKFEAEVKAAHAACNILQSAGCVRTARKKRKLGDAEFESEQVDDGGVKIN